MLRHTSHDRSLTLTDLLQMNQGDLCGLDSKSLTKEDAIRMVALLAYVTDNLLTLSEESPLQVLNSGDLRRDLQ